MANLFMRPEEPASTEIPNTLFIIASVILTVLVALFLALSDELQTRLPSPVRPTAVAVIGRQATQVPPSAATPSPSNTPDQTSEPDNTATPTAVSIIAQASCNNAPANWIPVLVGPNDTLYDLSIRYGATIGEIIQANCLEATTVIPGMIIYLPPSPPTRIPCGPPQWWTTYIVRPGETLGLLALRHGTTVYAIMLANCLSNTKIFAGRRLFLPPIPPTAPPPTIIFPSSTPMPSPTVTPTGLPSPTSSATADGTTSPTPTGTILSGTAGPTGTPVPTNTQTATATLSTGTPPATNTPTPAVSGTPAPTTSPSPTSGPSPTAVPTSTPTLPPTNTPVSTQPPTNTPPPTATIPPQPTDMPEF